LLKVISYEKGWDKNYCKQGKRDKDSTIHYYLNSFFKHRVSEKIIQLANENKDFPPKIDNKAICLDYHMKGKYPKESICPYSLSHRYIPTNGFRCLIVYSKRILSKYEKPLKEEEREDIKKDQMTPKIEKKEGQKELKE